MDIARKYLQTKLGIGYALLALALALVLLFSFSSFASAAPKVSNDPLNFNLVSLSPASGPWGTKVTITTDVNNLGTKRPKSYKVNVNSSLTSTVATSTDGGKTYTFVLDTLCPENGLCPALWLVAGNLSISLRDSHGTNSNTLIFALVE